MLLSMHSNAIDHAVSVVTLSGELKTLGLMGEEGVGIRCKLSWTFTLLDTTRGAGSSSSIHK